MIDTLKRFLKGRKLELCAEKTKIVVLNKHEKKKKEAWKWRVERLRRYVLST